MISDAPNAIALPAEPGNASSSDRKLAADENEAAVNESAHPLTPGDPLPTFTRIFDTESWRFAACFLSMGLGGCAGFTHSNNSLLS